MHPVLPRPLTIALTALTLVGLFVAPKLHADAGHDHGAAAPNAASPGSPRFAATSELFEVVGVVDGRQLTLYLDRSDDNSPVLGAKLELELGGNKIDVKPRADGEFEATLAQPLKPGVFPVTATVTAGTETDLLAGELSVPEQAAAAAPGAPPWRQIAGWAAAGLFALGVMAWFARRAWGRRAARFGAAA